MTRIHIQLPTNNDAYAKYRILDPVKYCGKQLAQEDIHITVDKDIDVNADVIVLHGMLDPYHLRTVEELATTRPLIWSCDDAMYDIPDTNPIHNLVGYTEKEVMKYSLNDLAAAILTPTQACAEYYGHPDKTYVAPNLIDASEYTRFKPRKEIKRIGWVSGQSHWADGDLVEHLPAQYPDQEFVFFSTLPEKLTQYRRDPGGQHIHCQPTLKNVGYLRSYPFYAYQSVLNALELDCGLAPLHNTVFNRCKSTLKWLEYSAMGLPTIASNVVPYKHSIEHGITGYLVDNNPEAWTEAIRSASLTVGRNAYFEVLEHWSWQSPNCQEIWLNYFRSIAN